MDDKVVSLEQYRVDKQLQKQLHYIDEAQRESQRSVRRYLMGILDDDHKFITKTTILNNSIYVEFVRMENPPK